MWGDFGGPGVVLGKWGGGCLWLGGFGGLSVVGWVVVPSYVAVFRIRGAPPPVDVGASAWEVFGHSRSSSQ